MSQIEKYLFANTSKVSSKKENGSQKLSKSSNQSPINMSRKTSITPTKIRETSPFSNKFYNRTYERDEIKRLREENEIKHINDLSQTKKLSQNSYRILCKQLEEKLALEIQKLDMQETKKLSFEQIGRLLTVFEVFDAIQYNEQSELMNQEIFYSQESHIVSRRDEEMEFHEQIWMILSNYEKDGQYVQADFVFAILRLLFDPAQLKVEQQETLFTHYILKQFPNTNAKKQKFIKEIEGQQYMPWSTKQFIHKYRKLIMTRISKVQLGQMREKAHQELLNSTQYSYKPQINEKSKILDELNKSKLQLDHLLFSKDGEIKQKGTSRSPTPDRIVLLHQKNEIKNNKIKQQQELIKQNELKQCTFHPQTNHNSINASRAHSKSPNRSQSQKSFDTENGDRVFERLYSQRSILPDKNEIEQRRRQLEEQKEQEQLRQCTFQPQLTTYSPSNRSKSPNGFDRTVGRLRLGHQKHVEYQQKLEHKPAGEGYEQKQKQKFNPPEMIGRNDAKYKPFIVLDINVRPGKNGRIGICEGDNPVTLAKNFSKAYDLDQDMEETVLEIIQQQIQNYYSKKQLKSVKSSTQIQNSQQLNQNKTTYMQRDDNYYNDNDDINSQYYSQTHHSYASYS
ncbi:hypothetical protein ABPG72_004589 [Tetrahymena utriculariae]